MKISELIILILWAFGLVNLLEPFNGFIGYLGYAVFSVFFISHIFEIFIFHNLIKSRSSSYLNGILMTFIFGVIYLRQIRNN
tara:strand:- start:13293 stop:13538 length:246 start_codon:yes stop_codon:yes gene_type:complete